MAEYLEDYAQNGTKEKGYRLIQKNMEEMEQDKFRQRLEERLEFNKKRRAGSVLLVLLYLYL